MTDWPAEVERIKAEHDNERRRNFTRSITPDEVMNAVCEISRVPRHEIIGPGRQESHVRARRVAVGLFRDLLDPPPGYIEISHWMVRAGHSTAMEQHQHWRLYTDAERKRWHDEAYSHIIRARSKR